jgi:chemotaxis protein histidine kinase CheA
MSTLKDARTQISVRITEQTATIKGAEASKAVYEKALADIDKQIARSDAAEAKATAKAAKATAKAEAKAVKAEAKPAKEPKAPKAEKKAPEKKAAKAAEKKAVGEKLPPMKERIKKVLGSKSMDCPAIMDALKIKNWLPDAKDPKAYVSFLLSGNPNDFKRVSRGVYCVNTDKAEEPKVEAKNSKSSKSSDEILADAGVLGGPAFGS